MKGLRETVVNSPLVDHRISSNRQQFVRELAGRLATIPCPHPLRVAIDGIDAAGKTTLAGELEIALQAIGRPVIRASLDGFHRPRAERYRRGPNSPEGYYHDSFDLLAIRDCLLVPLGPGGNRRFRPAIFDYRRDAPLPEIWLAAAKDAILLFDGVFLLRPELNPQWDFRIFIQLSFETAIERGIRRDLPLAEPGELELLRRRYRQRYLPGQQIYLGTVHPTSLADTVLDNEVVAHPILIKQG